MLEQLTDDAIKVAVNNRYRGWTGAYAESAETRFKLEDYIYVNHVPKFTISAEDRIFTIGSCFAREVESSLIQLGIPLSLNGYGVAADQFASWNEATRWGGGVPFGVLSRGALNKYSVHSMSSEISRVLDGQLFENDGMFEIKDGQWFDPHSSGLKLTDFDSAKANRAAIYSAMSQIKSANVVVMTLGLTETWFDIKNGIVMNSPLGGADLRRHKDRFVFRNYDYPEILAEMDSLLHLVRSKCSPAMRFIVTVSPVPMTSTWTNVDVFTANTRSKSILRAVASKLAEAYGFVDYFPSYEIVMNSPRHLVWRDDQLHVDDKMVHRIMKQFAQSYLPQLVAT